MERLISFVIFFHSVGTSRDATSRLEYQLLQISLYDHVLDGRHGDFEEGGVGGVREMAIDLSCRGAVEGHKFLHEVCACLLPAVAITREIGEAKFADRDSSYLRLEEIDLV